MKCFVYINFHKHLNFNRTNLNEAKDQPTSCRPLYCLHFSPIIIFKNIKEIIFYIQSKNKQSLATE